jgi:hypothetical protein
VRTLTETLFITVFDTSLSLPCDRRPGEDSPKDVETYLPCNTMYNLRWLIGGNHFKQFRNHSINFPGTPSLKTAVAKRREYFKSLPKMYNLHKRDKPLYASPRPFIQVWDLSMTQVCSTRSKSNCDQQPVKYVLKSRMEPAGDLPYSHRGMTNITGARKKLRPLSI